jgi:hypothetical protein
MVRRAAPEAWLAGLSAAAIALGIAACGKVKGRDEPVLVVGEPQASRGPQEDDSERLVRRLKEIYDLYGGSDGLTREELANLLSRAPGGADAGLVELLFRFDADGDTRLTLNEAIGGISSRVPTLGWIPAGEGIARDELVHRLHQTYPDSSQAARDGLAEMLFRFDAPWAGGDGDERLERRETAMAGIVIGAVGDLDFSEGVPTSRERLTPDRAARLVAIERKVNAQVFGRYAVADHRRLGATDRKLEWTQFALQYFVVDKMAKRLGAPLPPDRLMLGLFAYGSPRISGLVSASSTRWPNLRRLYDNPLNLGNGDHRYSTLEIFHLLTDLEQAQKILAIVGPRPASGRIGVHPALFDHLLRAFPLTGRSLFLGANGAARPEYWDRLIAFDRPLRGGNQDGILDAGEVAFAADYARILEMLFATYDTDHDGWMRKAEAREMLRRFDLDDPQVLDFMFTEAADHSETPDLLDMLGMGLGLATVKERLSPFELYLRLERILAKKLG